MAQRPLSNAKMFTATWSEKDEALLIDLLNRKINELRFDIRDAESPYIKARLRAKRKEYKAMLAKVITGDYNSSVLASELATAKLSLGAAVRKKSKGLGKYADSYQDVDFDFKSFFGKTRYYGMGLPFFMFFLLAVLAIFMLISFILPTSTINTIETSMSSSVKLSTTSIAYIRLGEGVNDFRVPNNGDWPKGTFLTENDKLEQGDIYKDANDVVPDYVYLYADLKMTSIDITAVDMLKSVFRMPMFGKNRVDFIENLDKMQGRSWYYIRFMNEENRLSTMELPKNSRGNLDFAAMFSKENLPILVSYVCTYGAVVCLWITVLLSLIELIICLARIFTFTSRRLHIIPILMLLFGLLAMLMPAFAEISTLDGATISSTFSNYFTIYWDNFIMYNDIPIIINLLYLGVLAAVPVILILLPLIMHNRKYKPVTFVPKGNRPHIYAPNELPIRPGKVPKYGLTQADRYPNNK